MKYERGDTVLIRSHNEGSCGWIGCADMTREMRSFIGKQLTIKAVHPFYRLTEDIDGWNWSSCMFMSSPTQSEEEMEVKRMRSKFEKGENVLVINSDSDYFNQSGVVVAVDDDEYKVELENDTDWFDEDELRSKGVVRTGKTVRSTEFAEQAKSMTLLKTLSTLAKKTFDKKTQNYIQLGWLDDTLEVTPAGIEAVAEVAFSGETLEELAARRVAEAEKEAAKK